MTRREMAAVVTRYTQWDGTQRLKLDADKVFEKLAEYLSYTDDVRQAMDWMMRQGMDFDGVKVMGLEEFIEQLRQEMRQRYRDFNLKNALSEMEQKLEDILNRERTTLESMKGQKPGIEEKQRELSRMPRRLSEAMRKLESHEFEDAQAKEDFDKLLEEYENIRDLENFRDRNQHMFHGPKSLGYEDALELMREMERMRQLEQDLMSGNFDTISMEDLQQILGQQASKDFQNLKQVMVLLTQSGYMVPKGDHFQLSPKGVRRIGQLALRDIYQNLLKDRSGGHVTDHRGVTEMRPEQTKPYAYGDPLNLNLVATLKHALARKAGVPLEFGNEVPNPIPNRGTGGYPITLQYPPFDKVTGVSVTLVDGANEVVPFHLSTPEHPATSFGQFGVICVIPQQRLRTDTKYTVSITATWKATRETRSWSFTTLRLRHVDASDETAVVAALGQASLVRGTVLNGGMVNTETAFLQIASGSTRYTMASVLIPLRTWTVLGAHAAPGTWKGKTIEVEATPELVQGRYLNLPIELASQLRVVR